MHQLRLIIRSLVLLVRTFIANMQALAVFCVLIATCYAKPQSRIVFGNDVVNYGEHPHQVSLVLSADSSAHFCGGSLIKDNYVLTAAHCVEWLDSTQQMQVVVGEHIRSQTNKDQQYINVKTIIMHENYNTGLFAAFTNDIALLELEKPVIISDNVKTIDLATSADMPVNETCVITGWGRTILGQPLPDVLQEVDIQVISTADCRSHFGFLTIIKSHVCVYNKDSAAAACNGDSGGPLVCNNKLAGVTSFGVADCGMNPETGVYPSVYTRVPDYTSWINQKAI